MAAPLFRLLELDTCLKSGIVFPRWFPDLYGGRGGLFFNFYAPLSYYVAEFFRLAGGGYIVSVKAAYALSFVLSGISMYLFAKEKTNRHGALAAAVLYMYAPYRFVDVYVRGDLAESFAFVFMPLILLSLERLSRDKSATNILILAASYAALILTHNVIALLFTYFIVIYSAYLAYVGTLPLRETIVSIFMALLLAAFYWVPAILEMKYVQIERAIFGFQFVRLSQMLPGISTFIEKNTEVSYEIGVIHLVLALVSLFLLREKYARFIFLALCASMFMMTSYSALFWRVMPFGEFIQFPWRLLAIVALLTSLLGGLTLGKFKMFAVRTILFCLLVVFLSYNFIGYSQSLDLLEGDISREGLRSLNTGLTYRGEYLPASAIWEDSPIKRGMEVVEGSAIIYPIRWDCGEISFSVSANTLVSLKVNVYWYPGWKVYVNGLKVDTKNMGGLIGLQVPKGESTVVLRFGDTVSRRLAVGLSLSAFVVIAVIILRRATEYLRASRLLR